MKPIHKILIANRGEIASRIVRSCRKMGISSVAVYSEADKNAPFVKEADSAVFIGQSEAKHSYLNQDKILEAAKKVQTDAIHPGYGFLSENHVFAKRCIKEGLIFIGPNAEAIKAMGSKSEAKAIMEKSDVPVIPGYKGKEQSDEKLIEEAVKIGFPLLLKATAGGGGKGMRIVRKEEDLGEAIAAAKREAVNAFGDDELLIEKYIESGRHIEFQIFGDQHGNIVHLLERECTIQRRYQKVIEESPSPIMTDALREKMGSAAISAAKSLNYDNAGTVEFIFDDTTGDFFFLEVNTRLQVEHPVTECVTGLDLVQMQIEVAMGKPLSIQQNAIVGKGYAVEARLYAEDPANNFIPATGKIVKFQYPMVEGLRVDGAIQSGSEISMFYDPMIAKFIVWDKDRATALAKLSYVLRHTVCQGSVTNLKFLASLYQFEDFRKGNYNTHFIAKNYSKKELEKVSENGIHDAVIAATFYAWKTRNQNRSLLKELPSGWRNNFYQPQKETFKYGETELVITYHNLETHFECVIDSQTYQVNIADYKDEQLSLEIGGIQKKYTLSQDEVDFYVHEPSIGNLKLSLQDRLPEKKKEKVKGGYEAAMPSQIVKINVKKGDTVKAGTPLVVTSSMKMENTIISDSEGIIEEVFVKEGQNIESGHLMLKIKTEEA